MKRVVGIVIGIGYLGVATGTVLYSTGSWRAGHSDIGFWFTVIAGFLTIAGLAAIVGTWIHTGESEG